MAPKKKQIVSEDHSCEQARGTTNPRLVKNSETGDGFLDTRVTNRLEVMIESLKKLEEIIKMKYKRE